MSKRKGNPARQSWDPIKIGTVNPADRVYRKFIESDGREHFYNYRTKQRAVSIVAFYNRLYNGTALEFEDGSMHIDFKRNDRAAVRDWRHFQAIKNSVAGPEREAIEIFPPESALMDAANQYHLWVLPEGQWSPLGFEAREVGGEFDGMDHARYRQTGVPGGRQRPWEEGIPTGLGSERPRGPAPTERLPELVVSSVRVCQAELRRAETSG